MKRIGRLLTLSHLKSCMASALSVLLVVESAPAQISGPSTRPADMAMSLPSSLGFITDVYSPRTGETGTPDVVLIQNLHVNRSVQFAISGILKRLKSQGLLPDRIAVEGASGLMDTASMQRYPDASIRKEAADYLVQQGEMPGAMHFVVTEGAGNLYGVETNEVYLANLEVFQRSFEQRSQLGKELAKIKAVLPRLKRDPALREKAGLLEKDIRAVEQLTHIQTVRDEMPRVLRQALLAIDHLKQILPQNNSQEIIEPLSAAANFYALALMRDEDLFKNTLALRKQDHQQTTVLITGGFHTQGLTEQCKRAGLSYVVFTPQVRRHTAVDEKLYLERLLGHHLTPEQVATGQDWAATLMLEPLFNEVGGLFSAAALFFSANRGLKPRLKRTYAAVAMGVLLALSPSCGTKPPSENPAQVEAPSTTKTILEVTGFWQHDTDSGQTPQWSSYEHVLTVDEKAVLTQALSEGKKISIEVQMAGPKEHEVMIQFRPDGVSQNLDSGLIPTRYQLREGNTVKTIDPDFYDIGLKILNAIVVHTGPKVWQNELLGNHGQPISVSGIKVRFLESTTKKSEARPSGSLRAIGRGLLTGALMLVSMTLMAQTPNPSSLLNHSHLESVLTAFWRDVCGLLFVFSWALSVCYMLRALLEKDRTAKVIKNALLVFSTLLEPTLALPLLLKVSVSPLWLIPAVVVLGGLWNWVIRWCLRNVEREAQSRWGVEKPNETTSPSVKDGTGKRHSDGYGSSKLLLLIMALAAGLFHGQLFPAYTQAPAQPTPRETPSQPATKHATFDRIEKVSSSGTMPATPSVKPAPSPQQTEPIAHPTPLTKSWSEDFDGPAGSKPDPKEFGYDLGAGGWGNRELENYTNSAENAYLDGKGHLVIRVIEKNGTYTSARIKTQGRLTAQYGRIEARIKLPTGQGIWPAFWMLGDTFDGRNWPGAGEIDIMENRGGDPSISYGTVHGPGYSGGRGITATFRLSDGQKFSDDFHTFAIDWSPKKVTFLVDGKAYHTVTPDSLPPGTQWVFDQPFFMILNVAVGGNFGGNSDSTTHFPQEMVIDSIHYTPLPGGIPAKKAAPSAQPKKAAPETGDLKEITYPHPGPAMQIEPVAPIRTIWTTSAGVLVKIAKGVMALLLAVVGLSALGSSLGNTAQAAVPMGPESLQPLKQAVASGHFASPDILTIVTGLAVLASISVVGILIQNRVRKDQTTRIGELMKNQDLNGTTDPASLAPQVFSVPGWLLAVLQKRLSESEYALLQQRLNEQHTRFRVWAAIVASA
jgi:beta-glucanase (GH16 family)